MNSHAQSTSTGFGRGPTPGLTIIGRLSQRQAERSVVTARDPKSYLPASVSRGLIVTGGAALRFNPAHDWPGDWDIWRVDAALPEAKFDTILLAEDVLETVSTLRDALVGLTRVSSSKVSLFIDFEPSLSWELLAGALEGDLSDGTSEALGAKQLFSVPGLYKLLLDTGWVPSLASETSLSLPQSTALEAALQAATALGIPRGTAVRNWQPGRLLLRCERLFEEELASDPEETQHTARFSVVVPTTRPRQSRLNVEASPGLREVQAQLISVHGAKSASDAWDRAAPHLEEEWVLFCHQDVYFPAGFGRRLSNRLALIEPSRRPMTLLGFAGMGVAADRSTIAPAGFVIDRRDRFDHPATQYATSLDELAIVMHRDTLHRIDATLGWHLWATDLCVTAVTQHKCFAEIVRMPLFHNSANDYVLPAAFHAAAGRLANKHSCFGSIETLCGRINPTVSHIGAAA
jgi:hypothetical protein